MNKWQEGFVKKVEGLREESAKRFDHLAGEEVERIYREFADFTSRHDFQPSKPQSQNGSWTFKFALTEDVYVLVTFRLRGFDLVDCDYECFVPTFGRGDGVRSTTGLQSVNAEWLEQCFRMALDDLVARFADTLRAEPVLETQVA